MFKRSLISMAAIAATSGFAFAAEPMDKPEGSSAGAPAGKPAAEQMKPANESVKAMDKPNSEGPAEKIEKPSGKNAEMKDGTGKPGDAKPEEMKSGDMKSGEKPGDMKTGEKSGEMKSGDKLGNMKDADSKSPDAKAGAKGDKAALTKVTPEQKTQVKSAFTKHRVEPAKISVSVNVGVAIPRETHLYSVPEDILVIAPAYRDYRYFIVGDRVCIVDPETFEIVDIIILA